jgi:cobalamin biosynthesis protein CobT
MNRDIIELREVITKLVPLLSGKGLAVTQRGSQAYVKTDVKTKQPILVNIPNIPDNAQPEFIAAISGFVDHEVAHVLHTDWNYYGGKGGMSERDLRDPKRRAFMQTHNIIEDVMIEREQVKTFPGAARNLSVTRKWFLEKITDVALKGVKDPKEQFRYILVPMMRALGGHEEMQEWMDKRGYWKHPMVEELLKTMKPATLDLLKKATTTKETLAVTEEVHDILMGKILPPAPPAPPAAPEPEVKISQKGKSQDKPEKEAGEGDGDGERDHKDKDPGDSGKGEESKGEDEAEGEGSGSGSKADDKKSKGKDKKKEEEPAEEVDDEPETAEDGVDGEASEDEPDEDSTVDGEDVTDKDPDAEEDETVSSGAEDGDENDDGEDVSSDSSDEDDDDGEGGRRNEVSSVITAGDEGGGEGEVGEGSDEEHQGGGGGVGNGGAKSMFDYEDGDFEEVDMSSQIAIKISDAAVAAMDPKQYLVFTRELDEIKPVQLPDNMNSKWVPEMEDETRLMTSKMQKDIERIMASQSHVIRTPGHRTGKLHAPSLFRVPGGDPRVFTQKQEHVSKDTAVSVVIDNSGSMGGHKMNLAMTAGYALCSTLDRVKIAHEVIGFTTGGYGYMPQSLRDAMAEEAKKARISWDRTTPIVMPIYKTFDERLTATVKARFAFMKRAQPGLNGNIDGESLEYAAERLLKRMEKRKVMLVLSDGQPAGGHKSGPHLAGVVKQLGKIGIECIGIGIMDDSVNKYYPKSTVLRKAEDLPGQVMTEIKKILIGV